MIPTFAVVGQPNKGKSSIVATLAEDEQIAIAPAPGTTRQAQRHVLKVDGEALYALVDTPGFPAGPRHARLARSGTGSCARAPETRGRLCRNPCRQSRVCRRV